MTAEQIESIRHMRGMNIPWTVVSRQLGYSVRECRQAIGMPTYDRPERLVLPWEQPQPKGVSER